MPSAMLTLSTRIALIFHLSSCCESRRFSRAIRFQGCPPRHPVHPARRGDLLIANRALENGRDTCGAVLQADGAGYADGAAQGASAAFGLYRTLQTQILHCSVGADARGHHDLRVGAGGNHRARRGPALAVVAKASPAAS